MGVKERVQVFTTGNVLYRYPCVVYYPRVVGYVLLYWRVGRETLEEAGKAPKEMEVVSTLGGTGRWEVVVDGSERVRQGASGGII